MWTVILQCRRSCPLCWTSTFSSSGSTSNSGSVCSRSTRRSSKVCIISSIMCLVPAGVTAVHRKLFVVLNQHRLLQENIAPYLTFSFWKTKAPRGAADNLNWPEWFVSARHGSKWWLGESSALNHPRKLTTLPGFLWSSRSLRSIELQISLTQNRQTHTRTQCNTQTCTWTSFPLALGL